MSEHKLSFVEALREQRWDDHRYYHHSRINQTLHLVSACCFVSAYVMIFINPIAAALLGWVCAMVSRQIGHFFFEPKSYDQINRATHEHKEDIKIGYNLRRKVVLIAVWVSSPLLLWWQPAMFGMFSPHASGYEFVYNLSVLWLVIGGAAILLRTAWLCIRKDVQCGMVWFMKILTDPFHDIKIYHRSPIYLLRGQLYDPMTDEWGKHAPAQRASHAG